MELDEIIALRPVTCAGLLVTMTRRCPLRCAHCSTASAMSSEQITADALRRFLRSITAADHPDVVLFTGGEPLLRPGLTIELAETARSAGTRSAVLTGAFFARSGRMPSAIERVVTAVDHFSVSMDAFHEREVPRSDVIALLRRLLQRDVRVSLHIVGIGPDDPYLKDVTSEIQRRFGGDVPMLVSLVAPVGRAASWFSAATDRAASQATIAPCAMAAWPVVAFDGTVTACCQQDVVDGRPAPDHLSLGHIATDSWQDIRSRTLESPMLRAIRIAGPGYLKTFGSNPPESAQDICAMCRRTDQRSAAESTLRFMAGPAGELLDREVARVQSAAGATALIERYGCAEYASLVTSGGRS